MTAARVSPAAPFGSLLKGAPFGSSDKPRKARVLNAKHLALVRRCPCLGCDADPARTAAHLRMTTIGKPIAGTGNKPDDRWALPLCDPCHVSGPFAQHAIGEPKFWAALGLDPRAICDELAAASPNIEAMRAVIFKAREDRK